MFHVTATHRQCSHIEINGSKAEYDNIVYRHNYSVIDCMKCGITLPEPDVVFNSLTPNDL
jgi:ribosomal protein S27E